MVGAEYSLTQDRDHKNQGEILDLAWDILQQAYNKWERQTGDLVEDYDLPADVSWSAIWEFCGAILLDDREEGHPVIDYIERGARKRGPELLKTPRPRQAIYQDLTRDRVRLFLGIAAGQIIVQAIAHSPEHLAVWRPRFLKRMLAPTAPLDGVLYRVLALREFREDPLALSLADAIMKPALADNAGLLKQGEIEEWRLACPNYEGPVS